MYGLHRNNTLPEGVTDYATSAQGRLGFLVDETYVYARESELRVRLNIAENFFSLLVPSLPLHPRPSLPSTCFLIPHSALRPNSCPSSYLVVRRVGSLRA